MAKLPPSVSMNKAIQQLLHDGTDAEDFLGELLRRGSAAILQEGLEGEVTAFLGRGRYERREEGMPAGARVFTDEIRLHVVDGKAAVRNATACITTSQWLQINHYVVTLHA